MCWFVDLNVSKHISLRTKPSSICKLKLHLRIAKLNFHDLEKAVFSEHNLPYRSYQIYGFFHGDLYTMGWKLASKIFSWINDLIHIPPICYWVQLYNTFDSQSILWTGSPKGPRLLGRKGRSKREETKVICWRWMEKVAHPETNSSPLKLGFPKRKLIFQPSIFRGYVSFREGTKTFQFQWWS